LNFVLLKFIIFDTDFDLQFFSEIQCSPLGQWFPNSSGATTKIYPLTVHCFTLIILGADGGVGAFFGIVMRENINTPNVVLKHLLVRQFEKQVSNCIQFWSAVVL
jgi:hypothetical protein